MSNKYLQV